MAPRSFPNNRSQFVDGEGTLMTQWYYLLLDLFDYVFGAPTPQPLTLTGSPFSYVAQSRGTVVVDGGTVSDITVMRGDPPVTVDMGVTSGAIPVSSGDTITITYAVAPTVVVL